MIDYSFLRLKDNLGDALNMQDSPATTHFFESTIQLLPNKTYLQITNVTGGLSLTTECEVFVVDCNDKILADITDNVFISEFVDSNSENQCKIEFVNLGVDFYRTTVLIKFKMLASDAVFWTNPINITAYQSELTSFFKYKNYDDFEGIGYTSANAYQSISLALYFDIPLDETETEDYFQISRNNTISARSLIKLFEQYRIEKINRFTFERLNILLKHELIYLDDVRVTNKPVVSSSEREGDSNFFETDLIVAKNYKDVSPYEFQIYTGLEYTSFSPSSTIANCNSFTALTVGFNVPITIESGSVTIFNNSGVVIDAFTEGDMTLQGNSDLSINLVGSAFENPADGSYYIHITKGLINSIFGEENKAILDNTTWAILLQGGDYSIDDYSIADYLTGCPPLPNPLVDDLTLFYKFNELSGTTATDDSALSNDGTITNVLIDQVGLVDKCYYFNSGGATNQYVTIPDADSLSFGSGAFSIEVWLNADANFGRILNKYNETTGDLEYRLFSQGGVLQFFIYTDASNRIGIADSVTFTTGAWQQIFITYDGSGDASGLTMKVNNVTASFASDETGIFTGMPNTTQPVILGQQADALTGANRYSGKMDILRMWKGYVVTDAEKTTLYNSGNGTETL